jgi:hypothetical protein
LMRWKPVSPRNRPKPRDQPLIDLPDGLAPTRPFFQDLGDMVGARNAAIAAGRSSAITDRNALIDRRREDDQ